MPCNDGGPPSYYDAYEDQRRRSDKLARMLCGLCGRIDALVAEGNIISMDDIAHLINKDEKLAEWWVKHQEQDAKRLAAEKAKKRKQRVRRDALKKLTAEEIEALGLE